MEILFLGTGSAWCTPEHSCECAVCKQMKAKGEHRTRTSFLLRGQETLLVDCGPDLQRQMTANQMERPDAVLITHEHADHFLGLDDLLAFRRALPKEVWTPIPVYATNQAWKAIELRFGYLLGSLIDKRESVPGESLAGLRTNVVPFKTFHGPSAPGSVGYVVEDKSDHDSVKIVYTSDFMRLDEEPEVIFDPDVLVIQSHWLNEPAENRPHHMSFQRAVEYIKRWSPKKATFLVHISDADRVPGDSMNNALKKLEPLSPMCPPNSSTPYPIACCQAEWEALAEKVRFDAGLPGPVFVARDGLSVKF